MCDVETAATQFLAVHSCWQFLARTHALGGVLQCQSCP